VLGPKFLVIMPMPFSGGIPEAVKRQSVLGVPSNPTATIAG
jgi:hypothetical protein